LSATSARGELWWCELPVAGRRPVVVPSEVVPEPGDDPVPQRCAVNLDSVESVSVAVLVERLGRLADVRMREICSALAIAVDCRD
jgi:mRNA interferase MazF